MSRARARERKRFDFMAWMENYLYIERTASASGRTMSEELNRIIDQHRNSSDISSVKPASHRTQ